MTRRRSGGSVAAAVAGGVVVLAACSAPEETLTIRAVPVRDSTVTTTTVADVPTSGAGDVLTAVRDSIVLVTTPNGQGSGVVLEGGLVVTCAHVVDPFSAADITFENGGGERDVPVLGVEPYADIALLGPVESVAAPLTLAPELGLDQGDDVFLVGYPGETDASPQVAISRGIVSRLREADLFGLTYVQTDAAIGGGQSGGALFDSSGHLVGISGLAFAEEFALAVSSPDVIEAVDDIRSESAPPYRPIGTGDVVLAGMFDVRSDFEQRVLVLPPAWTDRSLVLSVAGGAAGPTVEIGNTDGSLWVVNAALRDSIVASGFDPGGYEVMDEVFPGTYEVEAPAGAQLFVWLGTTAPEGAAITWSSNLPLVAQDDDRTPVLLAPGEPAFGVIDALEFEDTYLLHLEQGQRAMVRASTASGDAILTVLRIGGGPEDVWFVDDSNLGLYGCDAEQEIVAPATGEYLVVVGVNDGFVTGYRIDATVH